MFKVILYYKYVRINDPEGFKESHRKLCQALGLKGRIIVAKEGINGTLEGTEKDIEKYCLELKKDKRFKDVVFKISDGNGAAFPRLSIKVRPEIVALGDPDGEKFPLSKGAKYIEVDELHDLLNSDEEYYIFDMRNDYEHDLGHFKNSIFPKARNFRDTPEVMEEFAHLKDKQIVTVCTGGVRCERGSAILTQNGFKNVRQLHDGIVTYMDKYPGEDFEGALYVFDNRIAYKPKTGHKVISRCKNCGDLTEQYINCNNNLCHKHILCCDKCAPDGVGYCGEKCRASENVRVK